MEQDRYQQNHTLFITGMLTLLLSILLFGFAFYILPPLLWGWSYQIPQFVWDWQAFLQKDYDWTENGASWVIILTFLLPALVAGLIAWLASNRIDNDIYHIGTKKREPEVKEEEIAKANNEEAHSLEMKIFFLILLVIVGALILQWFFSATA